MNKTDLNRSGLYKSLAIAAVLFLVGFASLAHALAPGTAAQNANESLMVKDSNGDYIGTVSNALQDQSGNILFVVLSLGETPGNVDKMIAVPLTAFSYDHESGSLVVSISKEQLTSAPEFNASALDDPQFAERVFRYFGEAPAWTE